MNIRISSNVFEDPAYYAILDVIADLLQRADNRHIFDVSQHSSIVKSGWLSGRQGARRSTAEFIRSSANAVSREGLSLAVTIDVDALAPESGETEGKNIIRINPMGALRVLMEPFHLIVEDENSDGCFVLWMARLLGRDTVKRCYKTGSLSFRHAGGKGQFVKSAAQLTFGVWPRTDRPILSLQLRAAALIDSDARFPGDTPNLQFARETEPYVAFAHVLESRYVESYVPFKYAMRRLDQDGLAAALDAYFRMSEIQRRHFPIKKGFLSGTLPASPQGHGEFLADSRIEQEERDLYRSVDPDDWILFSGGFGERFISVFREPGLRCNPNEPGQLTAAQRTELNRFFDRVISHL